MLCIKNENTDPYFNLAAEEYILRNFTSDCFILWRNRPSIVVGKHQNTLSEINYEYVKQNDIDVIRRLSGGGTVFHDLGNLNFTFIQNVNKDENLVDFKKYTKPIIEVLIQLGVNAKFEGRNDIMIEGKKISGNAEHVYKNRVLHHGTLLFSSEIKDLSQALKVNPLIYTDKGVKSVRSRVTNISDYLSDQMSVLEFRDKIFDHISNSNQDVKFYEFTDYDIDQINDLVKSKYKTWQWNFGYSPRYSLEKVISTNIGTVESKLEVEKGIINKIWIKSNFLKNEVSELIKNLILNSKHQEDIIRHKFKNEFSSSYHSQITLDEIMSLIF